MKTMKDIKKSQKMKGKGKPLVGSLGPVQNLEEYVSPEWWNKIFNSLYLKTDGDVVEDLKITKSEIDLITDILNPASDAKILDLCCGQGRHCIEMASRGYTNVAGLDRSHYLIQKAKERSRGGGLLINFREGDARKLPYPTDSFDYVLILGNSFGYFETLQDDLQVLKEITRILKPWGKLLVDLTDGEYVKKNFNERSWEWINNKLFVCRERSLAEDGERLVSREVVTNVTKGVIADQFYAERLYSRDGLKTLLEKANFSEVTFAANFKPDSERNQDLGMMEQRIIAVATIKKEWSKAKVKTREKLREVAVLLGDPEKPDIIKPNKVFDDDAIYTICRLEESLRELKGYNFTFFKNHDTLAQDLLKIKGKVDLVLNLCDEGFMNEAMKELHVPALLEMLGIPYTGSGPQCLAYAYDKSLIRGIAKEMDIPVADAVFIKPEDTTFSLPIKFPSIVKPNFGDSSFGITEKSVVNDIEELIDTIQRIRTDFGYDKPLLVEEFLSGQDLTVGILGNPPGSYIALPIAEEDYSVLPEGLPQICGYEAKWKPDSPYWNLKSIRAELPEETKQSIIEWCVSLSERLGCRDYTRFDWRLNGEGMPHLLEVNPNPGWCWDGHLAKMAALNEISYPEMLSKILQFAIERLGIENGI